MQNPYAPPGMQPPPAMPAYGAPAWVPPTIEGDRITVSKMAWWPACCVKCGATTPLKGRSQLFAYVPPWTYALLPLGLLPAAIVQMALTKRATITLPVCPTCDGRWSAATLAWRLSLLGPVLLGFGGLIVGASLDSGALMAIGGLLFFPGILIFPLLAHFLLVKPRTLRVLFMDDQVIKLAGVAPASLALFRGAPGPG
jgi:hypothetical protein